MSIKIGKYIALSLRCCESIESTKAKQSKTIMSLILKNVIVALHFCHFCNDWFNLHFDISNGDTLYTLTSRVGQGELKVKIAGSGMDGKDSIGSITNSYRVLYSQYRVRHIASAYAPRFLPCAAKGKPCHTFRWFSERNKTKMSQQLTIIAQYYFDFHTIANRQSQYETRHQSFDFIKL